MLIPMSVIGGNFAPSQKTVHCKSEGTKNKRFVTEVTTLHNLSTDFYGYLSVISSVCGSQTRTK